MKNVRGLSMQLLRLLMLAGICAAVFLIIIHICTYQLIGKLFPGSELEVRITEKRIELFQDYILKNSISATDTDQLLLWCGKQPLILMEIYRDNMLYFNSDYVYEDPLTEQNIEMTRYDWYFYYELQFADGPADVLVYSDESFVLYTWATIVEIICGGVLFTVVVLIGIRKTIRYIYILCDEIQIMGGGDLEHPVTVCGNNELGLLAEELDHMRAALFYHHQKEQEMIRQNKEMITGLSHDLRTPLTKLLIYTEIIQNHRYEDEQHMRRYLTRIHEKGDQIKEISDHLFRYSLSQGEAKTQKLQAVSFKIAFFDRLSEMTDYLSVQGFSVVCEIDWSRVPVLINELLLDRILDNIVSNIEKYAEKTCPVEIRSVQNSCTDGISVKNMKSQSEDRMESNGVGVEGIRAMMQQMNGRCSVYQTETEFEISVSFLRQQS